MGHVVSHGSLINRELSHYRVVEKIGEGGMGEVYLAHDLHLGNNVALKVLAPGRDEDSRKAFRKEAKALSRLNHPNIVTVLDFDTQDDLDFLVMEYIPGLALDERVRRGTLREKEVVRIGMQLAEGLVAAHAQGVIHRDLKPGNMRLTLDDRLKILDFGLAAATFRIGPVESTLNFSDPIDCSGTLPYMASEQLLGKPIDGRTDVYSAGAVLYELYTGHPPFEQKLFTALVNDILHKAPIPPSQIKPGISPRLEGVILKCLEKAPEKRYQSARELQRAIHRVASAAPVSRIETWFSGKRPWYIAAGFATVVLGAALGWYGKYRVDKRPFGMPHIQSMAVLPFSNLSGDSQQEYLADGMTDFLITDLGQMGTAPRIISRTSVMRYKTEHLPLRDIASQLKVDAVIEGAVLRSDHTVEVTVRLVNTSDDRQLWSHHYESEFRDLLTMEHELALGIAGEINASLSANDRARLPASRKVEPAAQEAYLKAEYLRFGTSEQRAKAREYFLQAIQIDPNYAPVYAGLSDSYWNDISRPASESMPKAREYAQKAVALDESLAHGHTALATVQFYGDWDWAGADREYQRALQLNPNDAEAHRMYSVFLAAMGRSDEAWAQILSAQELDPLHIANYTTAGWNLYCARRYDQALQQCRRGLELAPNDQDPHACFSYSYLGKGQSPQAIEESKKAWTLSGEETVWKVLLGRAYAQAGNTTGARQILSEVLRKSEHSYVPPYFIVALYTALGDSETALQWLDKAYKQRDPYLAGIKADPAVDPLRSLARFQELSRQMGLSR